MSQATTSPEQIAAGLSKLGSFLRSSQWRQAEVLGMTATQGQILAYLLQRGASRISALAEELGVTQPTASDAVAALERKGMLLKRRDPADARAVRLHLTAAGRKAGKALVHWPESLLAALDSLETAERALLLRGLTKTIRELQLRGAIPLQRMCVSCRFFRPHAHESAAAPHHCDFVDAAFGESDLRLDCGDHEAAAPAAAQASWRLFARHPEAE